MEVGASLNGNTVASIVMGAAPVAAGSFEVSDDKLILKSDWLNTLAAGSYTLTVSYNPMGESFISGTSRGDAPQTTELVLTVKKAALTVTEKPILSGIYGTKVEDMTGGEMFDKIEEILPRAVYGWSLCPGHLVAEDRKSVV